MKGILQVATDTRKGEMGKKINQICFFYKGCVAFDRTEMSGSDHLLTVYQRSPLLTRTSPKKSRTEVGIRPGVHGLPLWLDLPRSSPFRTTARDEIHTEDFLELSDKNSGSRCCVLPIVEVRKEKQ